MTPGPLPVHSYSLYHCPAHCVETSRNVAVRRCLPRHTRILISTQNRCSRGMNLLSGAFKKAGAVSLCRESFRTEYYRVRPLNRTSSMMPQRWPSSDRTSLTVRASSWISHQRARLSSEFWIPAGGPSLSG